MVPLMVTGDRLWPFMIAKECGYARAKTRRDICKLTMKWSSYSMRAGISSSEMVKIVCKPFLKGAG